MPIYEYKGVNIKGRGVKGVIDADSPEVAHLKLKNSGIFITDFLRQEEIKDTSRVRVWKEIIFGARVPLKNLALMTYNLKTLLESGLPLLDALNALIEQESHGALKKVLIYIKESVSQGVSLADAMEAHPDVFSTLYVSIIRVGESSGSIDDALTQLTHYLEMQEKIRSKVIKASAYPLLMAIFGFFILFFLMTSIVPRVISVFEDTQMVLPLPTRILIGLSNFLSNWWFLVMGGLLAITYLIKRALKTDRGNALKDKIISRIPLVGELFTTFQNYRFSQTMEALLRSSVPLSESLQICSRSINNSEMEARLKEINEEIKEGESLADVLEKRNIMTGMTQIIAVGEQSGRLDEAFLKASVVYERSIDTITESILALLEPALIIIMGVIVGFIVLAILLPIFEMSQMAG